jgi:hypothetical protein
VLFALLGQRFVIAEIAKGIQASAANVILAVNTF